MFWSVRRLLHTLALDAPVPSAGLQKEGGWGGGSCTSLRESAKFEDNSKPSSHASHIRQKLVVQVVCTPGVCTLKGFDCSYSNGHNCCQQRIIFTVPTLCCLLPAFHQVRREATASLLIIHTRTRYQPSCGEQIEITRDTFCNTFYFNTWGLGTTIKHSRWKKTGFFAGVCGTFSRSSTLHTVGQKRI